MYLEAIRPSEAVGIDAITVEAQVTGGGVTIPLSCLTDSVTVTAFELQVHDLRHWDPELTNPQDPYSSGIVLPNGTELDEEIGYEVGGAITDATSICLVRLWPNVGPHLPGQVVLSKRGTVPDDNSEIYVLGGMTDGLNVPALPMIDYSSDSPIAHNRTMASGKCYYIPPESYLDSQHNPGLPLTLDNGETTELLFAFDWLDTTLYRKAFLLRRPPIVLVHGITSDPSTWPTHIQMNGQSVPIWDEETGLQTPTRLYRADWSDKSVMGYSENFGVVGLSIKEALDEYRTAYEGPPGVHDPARSFQGIRYAATRVDAVGHSQGGQLIRSYISNLTGAKDRGPGWPNAIFGSRTDTNAEGKFTYLRADNYAAGDIRRFIPIGSPFKGSPIANAVSDTLDQSDNLLGQTTQRWFVRRGIDRFRPELGDQLLGDDGIYSPPTCVADLSVGSQIQLALEGARYPEGYKAVPWAPVVGIASQMDSQTETALWELLFIRIKIINDLTRVSQISELNPTNSDLIVEMSSQMNEQVIPDTLVFQFHIHAGLPNPAYGVNAETTSLFIAEKVRDLLSSDRNEYLLEGLDQ